MLQLRSGGRPRRRSISVGLAAVALAAMTVSCSDAGSAEGDAVGATDQPAVVTSQDPTGTPDATCAEVITDEVASLLGWVDVGDAVRSAGRCERQGTDNLVTVGVDPTVRPDGGADEVQAAYVDACQALSGEQVPQQDPDWLAPGASACVVGLDAAATSGFVEFYSVSETGWLVHGQVAQSSDVGTDDFRAAVSALVTNATAAEWG